MAQLGSLQDNDRASFKIIDDGGVDEIARRVDAPLVNDGLADVNANLDSIETKIDTANVSLDSIETKLDTVNSNLDSVEAKLDTANGSLDSIETKIDTSNNLLTINNVYNNILAGGTSYHLTGLLTTNATTADQQIIATTIPVGKKAYIIGWSVYTGNSGATVVKIGINTPLTETTNPGALNGVVFRAFGLPDVGRDSADYAVPRFIANAGDSLRMTVTPSKTATTTWRASIDFILVDA